MALWLIPLNQALPAVQAYLPARPDGQLTPAEEQIAAELLERCVRTGQALVAFALRVSGRPCPQ